MKTKLTQEQKERVDAVKAQITKFQDDAEIIYDALLQELSIVDADGDDALFDYIYNDYINPSNTLLS